LFKKLRQKFILLNMVTVVIVLTLAFVAICSIYHYQEEQVVYQELTTSIQLANSRDTTPNVPDMPTTEDDTNPQSTITPPSIGRRTQNIISIPVAVYSMRTNGAMTQVSEVTTATIDETTLAQAASYLKNNVFATLKMEHVTTGLISDQGLYYAIEVSVSGMYVSFADVSNASGWKSLAFSLALVEAGMLCLFFLISLFFSKWALRPAKESWEAQKRFVADASHDLKTPLTVIQANQSILLEHPDASIASQSQWIENTQTEAAHMQELIADMLLLAKHDEGVETAELTPIDLSELTEIMALEFESVSYERSVTLQTAIETNLMVNGDRARLVRLLSTLIDNGLKYAGMCGQVTVALCKRNQNVVLSVTNTGEPIAEEDLDHIFERFYRSDFSRTQTGDQNSHGLGLAIAKAIAEEHGGTISVQSSEEAGTVFTVELPLA